MSGLRLRLTGAAAMAAMLAGCQSEWVTPGASQPAIRQVVTLDLTGKTGTVRLRVRGLKPGFATQTFVSPLDLFDHLTVRLSHPDWDEAQEQTLDRSALESEVIEATFEGVPAGTATLSAEAFNGADASLGEASQTVEVTPGETAVVPLTVPVGYPAEETEPTSPSDIPA